ncbi:MAG: STT3 domain-containing protein [archaeon]
MGEDKFEKDGNLLIEKRKKDILKFLKSKGSLLVILGVIILIFLTWHTRTVNLEQLKDITTGDYTLGPDLDPFLFLRYAEMILETGDLVEVDYMRYVPLGYNTAGETRLLPYMIVYLYKVLNFFNQSTLSYAAVIFPALMFLLTAVTFFLFVRKVFDKHKYMDWISLIATAFLIVSPSLLSRTVAGIPEKESAGFFFMFLAFYFFIYAWRCQSLKKSLILAVLAGVSTALMGLIWGGWIYIWVSIALFAFVVFIIGGVGKKEAYVYGLWWVFSVLGVMVFSTRFSLADLIYSTSTGIAFVVLSLIIVDYIVFNTKIKEIKNIVKMRSKVPDRVISIILLTILGIAASTIFLGISFIPNFVSHIFFSLTQPYTDRLSFTVAENRQPYFSEWAGSFGPIVGSIPLFFWLFFLGSILLFYDSVKKLEKKRRGMLLAGYILFLFALIFSRYGSNHIMNGMNNLSKGVYFGGFIILGGIGSYIYYKYYKEGELTELKKIDTSYLFLIAFFIVSLIGARSAVRLIMVLSPPAAGIVGFFTMAVIERARKEKEETLKMALVVGAIIIAILSIYAFYFNYQVTVAQARGMVPSSYTNQWQKAMEWVRTETPEEAVFSHWWDYGYWVQTIGERATVLDGGNSLPYWNHLIARHVLTGNDEKNALEFLYTHEATHLLIDSTDVGKYPAYSTIGSDENYDRASWLPVMQRREDLMKETKNGTVHYYEANFGLDEDILWEIDGGQVLLPGGVAGVGAIQLKIENNELKQPEAIVIDRGKQYNLPLRYVYYKGELIDFGGGLEAGIFVFQRLISDGSRINGVDEIGAAIYLSPRTIRGYMARLYLLDEQDTPFKLVHVEENLIVSQLRAQGLQLDSFVLYGGLLGPIKIWEIEYPGDITVNGTYLELDFSNEELKISRSA